MADNAGTANPQGPAIPDARAGSPPATPPGRSFAVEAHAGRKIAGWPLGRFDIGEDRLRVRLGFPWFTTRSADKDSITIISVARIVPGVWCIRFRLGHVGAGCEFDLGQSQGQAAFADWGYLSGLGAAGLGERLQPGQPGPGFRFDPKPIRSGCISRLAPLGRHGTKGLTNPGRTPPAG